MTSTKSSARWAELLLSAAVLLVAALLIWQCLDIYRIGTASTNIGADGVRLADIYTREDVAARLARISWSFWVLLGTLVCAVVWRHIEPCAPARLRPSPDMQLEAMLLRRDKTPAMLAEERKRRVYVAMCGVVCGGCALMSALYLLNPTSFASTDLETVMAAMVAHILPWLLLALGAMMVLAQLRHGSLLREIAAGKLAPTHPSQMATVQPTRWKPWVRAVLYVAAVGLIVAGILNGGMYDVLVKAVNICTECIGLG